MIFMTERKTHMPLVVPLFNKEGKFVGEGKKYSGGTIRNDGPENTGVTMRGIHMDAAGDRNTNTKPGKKELVMNIPSILL